MERAVAIGLNIMKRAKISVIVPAYNVRNYLEACIDSIINQTYTNLEIILVDDGSTDGTAELCDNLLTLDERIKVIHKENGGAADARNTGIDAATGEYISFIDGDDCIDIEMYSTMLSYFDERVSIVSCGINYQEVSGSKRIVDMGNEVVIFSGEQALADMLKVRKGIIGCSPCNKIYNRKLFQQIRFKKGIIGEDIELLYRLYLNCDKIICINQPFYYYIKREGSVTTSSFSPKKMDFISTAQQIERFVEVYYPNLLIPSYLYELMWLLSAYKSLYYANDIERYDSYKMQLELRIKENMKIYKGNIKLYLQYWWLFFTALSIRLHLYKVVRLLLGK